MSDPWLIWYALPPRHGMAFYHYCRRRGDRVRRRYRHHDFSGNPIATVVDVAVQKRE